MAKNKYVKQHYVPQLVLENFTHSNEPKNLYYLDLILFEAKKNSPANLFYEKNLYDIEIDNDEKAIEKKLGQKIETPIKSLFDEIINTKDELEITRKDVEKLKKYMLVQIYRSNRNKISYEIKPKDPIVFSSYNKKESESAVDFWKQEINYIVDHSWDEILSSELVGVKQHATILQSGFLGFFKTDEEFVLNDLGYAIERIPIEVSSDIKKMTDDNIESFSKMFNIPLEDLRKKLEYELKENNSYVDNMYLFPISPKCSIAVINNTWINSIMKKSDSILDDVHNKSILKDNILPPIPNLINADKIGNDLSLIPKYKTLEDTYFYIIQKFNTEKTLACNLLSLNEVTRYLTYKTPKNLINTIRLYNQLEGAGTLNTKKNYKGFIDLIKSQK